MNTKVLSDANFETEYNAIIGTFCDTWCSSKFYETYDGKKMHFLELINEDAKANLILFHGFTECAEKFTELAYYFFNEGYSVYIPELRGHGLSYKDKAPEYGVAISDFDIYAKDISFFIKNIVGSDLPLYCWSHSLGGNALLLALMSDVTLPVKKVVLSSPMICGNMGMPVGVAKVVAKLMLKIGKGGAPAPGKCEFHPEKGNPDASSVARGDFALKQKADNKEYQTCGPVFEWVLRSIEARDKLLMEENIIKLNAEMLLIKPETDAQLLEKPQDEFFAKCRKLGRKISKINTTGTCHEIFQSKSEELESYINDILEFFDK